MDSINKLKLHRKFINMRKRVLGEDVARKIKEDYKMVKSEGNGFLQVIDGENTISVYQFNDAARAYSAFDMIEQLVFERDIAKSVQAKVNPIVWKDERIVKMFFAMFEQFSKEEEISLAQEYAKEGKVYGPKQRHVYNLMYNVTKSSVESYINEVVNGKKEQESVNKTAYRARPKKRNIVISK